MRFKFVNEHEAYGPGRCRLVDAETGEAITGVISATIDISPENDYRPIATILVELEVDLETYGGTETRAPEGAT